MPPLIEETPPDVRMDYRVGRGEQGVLSFEPYKSHILPLWRFRTVPIAKKSSEDLWQKFIEFDEQGDFVGMDMTRKFIQMGFVSCHQALPTHPLTNFCKTRAKRYANHAGGRKYDKTSGKEIPRSGSHKGKEEKLAASAIFREVWERCKQHEGYQQKKVAFLKEQKEWRKDNAQT